MELTGLQIFKYLPGAKKLSESNCKKCGFPTCMAYALKLAKKQTKIEHCPHIPDELKEKFLESVKVQQHELKIGDFPVGGENVMFRHDRTFVNKTAILIKLNPNDSDFEKKLEELKEFHLERVGEKFTIDGIYLEETSETVIKKIKEAGLRVLYNGDENSNIILDSKTIEGLTEKSEQSIQRGYKNIILSLDIRGNKLAETIENLTQIRRQAVLKRFEPLTFPVMVKFSCENVYKTCAEASALICKYANIIVLEDFNKSLMTTLLTLRQNIYTNPQKPLQVESKVYEFNEPDENSVVLMTTNFALTYFAVANELESMPFGSYLIVTPSDGMSVLTAWSADKFNAEIVAKMMSKTDLSSKVNKREIIIPGLLSHMKEELEEALPEWKIIVGTIEAFQLHDFIKNKV